MLCEQQIQSDFLRATTNHLHQWYNPLYLVETAIVMRQSKKVQILQLKQSKQVKLHDVHYCFQTEQNT